MVDGPGLKKLRQTHNLTMHFVAANADITLRQLYEVEIGLKYDTALEQTILFVIAKYINKRNRIKLVRLQRIS